MSQPHTYIRPLFLGFPSHFGLHRALSITPCTPQSQQLSHYLAALFIYFIQSINSVCMPTPTHPPCASLPLGVHTFVLHVCVTISALQVSSSIPFFYIPHVCVNIYLFFSEHVILQPEVGVGGIWQCLESFWNVVTCEGVLLVSSWQRSDAVNTL